MPTREELIQKNALSRAESVQQASAFVPDPNHQYVYHIWHTWEITPSTFHIQLPYPPTAVIRLLVAHLQFGASEFSNEYDMSNEDLGMLLSTFYGAEIIQEDQIRKYEQNVPIYSLDLYENWEMHCGMFDEVMGVKAFHREGLKEMLEKLVVEDQARENV